MATKEYVFDNGQILVPIDGSARLTSAAYGASLTLLKGQAMAQKTSDGKMYALNTAATDGTQTFAGFNQISCTTDANGLIFYSFGGTAAGANLESIGSQLGTIYTNGIFNPFDLFTAATGTAVAEVDTITPTSPTTGDLYSVYVTSGPLAGQGVEVTIGATQTATAATTLLANAWNDDPQLKAYAATSGTTTFILTAATAGVPLNLKSSVVGTGTAPLVITTAAVQAQQAEVDTFTATNPTTADVYTLTVTFPNLTTKAISATVGATQTATAIDALLLAAWNADTPDQYGNLVTNYATPSGTTTLILTAKNVGQTLSIAGTTTGTGTIAKVVTKPALGRSLADILPGAPGARILAPNGYWQV